MDSFLHDFVNEFEALGIVGIGFACVEFYLKFFFILEPLDYARQLIDKLVFASYCE
jgi:hypothetical protein